MPSKRETNFSIETRVPEQELQKRAAELHQQIDILKTTLRSYADDRSLDDEDRQTKVGLEADLATLGRTLTVIEGIIGLYQQLEFALQQRDDVQKKLTDTGVIPEQINADIMAALQQEQSAVDQLNRFAAAGEASGSNYARMYHQTYLPWKTQRERLQQQANAYLAIEANVNTINRAIADYQQLIQTALDRLAQTDDDQLASEQQADAAKQNYEPIEAADQDDASFELPEELVKYSHLRQQRLALNQDVETNSDPIAIAAAREKLLAVEAALLAMAEDEKLRPLLLEQAATVVYNKTRQRFETAAGIDEFLADLLPQMLRGSGLMPTKDDFKREFGRRRERMMHDSHLDYTEQQFQRDLAEELQEVLAGDGKNKNTILDKYRIAGFTPLFRRSDWAKSFAQIDGQGGRGGLTAVWRKNFGDAGSLARLWRPLSQHWPGEFPVDLSLIEFQRAIAADFRQAVTQPDGLARNRSQETIAQDVGQQAAEDVDRELRQFALADQQATLMMEWTDQAQAWQPVILLNRFKQSVRVAKTLDERSNRYAAKAAQAKSAARRELERVDAAMNGRLAVLENELMAAGKKFQPATAEAAKTLPVDEHGLEDAERKLASLRSSLEQGIRWEKVWLVTALDSKELEKHGVSLLKELNRSFTPRHIMHGEAQYVVARRLGELASALRLHEANKPDELGWLNAGARKKWGETKHQLEEQISAWKSLHDRLPNIAGALRQQQDAAISDARVRAAEAAVDAARAAKRDANAQRESQQRKIKNFEDERARLQAEIVEMKREGSNKKQEIDDGLRQQLQTLAVEYHDVDGQPDGRFTQACRELDSWVKELLKKIMELLASRPDLGKDPPMPPIPERWRQEQQAYQAVEKKLSAFIEEQRQQAKTDYERQGESGHDIDEKMKGSQWLQFRASQLARDIIERVIAGR